MKMVKSLLLGSAAGLAAVTGAQAADMPVKARPVEYVRICSLYGEGFFYIPGTDTCLKLGGYLRVQAEWGAGAGGIVDGSQQMFGAGNFTRNLKSDINYRVRGVASWDVRQQTEYGTLRTYIRFGVDQSTPAVTGGGTSPSTFWDRAFLQFAGFTVGRAQSFFDVWTHGGAYNYNNVRTAGDTGASGQNLWAYTAQFGNGLSGSVSLEDPATRKGCGTNDLSAANTWLFGFGPLCDNAFANTGNGVAVNAAGTVIPFALPGVFGFRVPDIVGNLRVDQAWGWAGVSAVLHEVSGAYYGSTTCSPAFPGAGAGATGAGGNCVFSGHPANKYGWAVAVGAQFNVGTPAAGVPQDTFGFQATFTEGAVGFVTNSTSWMLYKSNQSIGFAWLFDGVFNSNSEIELTRAWNINAAYQHFWNRKWRTSWYGGYVAVDYNGTATSLICARATGAGAAINPFNVAQPAGFNCNPDYSFFQVGSRTQWNPVPQLDIGLDIMYTKLNTAFKGPVNVPGTNSSSRGPCINNGVHACSMDDQSVWSAMFRWQRNFFP